MESLFSAQDGAMLGARSYFAGRGSPAPRYRQRLEEIQRALGVSKR
jgi:hypothetical protein